MTFLNLVAQQSKSLFLKWQYPSLAVLEREKFDLSTILDFPNPIIKNKCHNQKLKNLLNSSKFWQTLNEATDCSEQVSILQLQWENVKKFVDFNTQDLMYIKRNKFDSYEVIILQALRELRYNSERYEESGIWRPKWMLNWHREKLHELQSKYDNFLVFKKTLRFNLQLRARLYIDLQVSKYIDDLYLYFFIKINQSTDILPSTLKPEQLSSSLCDDTRLAIYDFLTINTHFVEGAYEYIIAPITQAPYRVPIQTKHAEQALKNINIFSEKIEHNLQLTNRAKYRKEKHIHERENNIISEWIAKPLSYIISPNRVMNKIKIIWRYRWGLALCVSLGLYFCFASAVITFIGLSIGMWAANIASNVLLFGIALLPAYVLGFTIAKQVGDLVYSTLGYWKKREIYQALELLKFNQRFITAQLSSGIRDIALFNIAQLEASSQVIIGNIHKMVTELQSVKGSAWLAYWGEIKASNQEVITRLIRQKQEINLKLKIYTDHISDRISERFLTFHNSIVSGQLIPSVPKRQIQNLYAFVEKHGNPEAIEKFRKSTELVELFITDLLSNNLLFRTNNKTTLKQPWGGYKSNRPGFYGWRTLIEHYEINAKRRAAALKIINVLIGGSSCNFYDLTQWVNIVSEANSKQLMGAIQQHIFLTLDCRSALDSQLLSKEQKALIIDWGYQFKEVLKSASKFVKGINNNPEKLSCINENILVRYFEALDGLERLNIVSGAETILKNPIRTILDGYSGNSSKLVYFLRFLPYSLRTEKISEIFSKRLNWLIDSFDISTEKTLDDADIELFKDPIFLGDLQFEEIMREHKKYSDPWSENFHQFLVMCVEYGLNDGSLLKAYKLSNIRVRRFMESSADIFEPPTVNRQYLKEVQNGPEVDDKHVVKGVRCA